MKTTRPTGLGRILLSATVLALAAMVSHCGDSGGGNDGSDGVSEVIGPDDVVDATPEPDLADVSFETGPDVPDSSSQDLGSDLSLPDVGADLDIAADLPTDVDPRQRWRERSLFENISFEDTGADGWPTGWSCSYFGAAPEPDPPCWVTEANAVHGSRLVHLAPEVAMYQDEFDHDPDRYVWFGFHAYHPGGVNIGDHYMFTMVEADPDPLVLDMIYPQDATEIESGWWYLSSGLGPMAGSDRLRMVFYNADPGHELLLDDFVALEEDDPGYVGHLLRSEHHTAFDLVAGTESATLWVPLPRDHGIQVPLHIELSVDPHGIVDHVAFTQDTHGNLGAVVEFPPDAAAANAGLTWVGVFLTKEATATEMTDLCAAVANPDIWTVDTTIVQSTYPAIVDTAQQVTQGITDTETRVAALVSWISSTVLGGGIPESQDAVAVFETHDAACTGFANLGAALGRAAGIPTRTVANYLLGPAHQTHYIDEFYLGPDKGWRLVEPQGTQTLLPGDFTVVLRIDLPEDEGPEAMTYDNNWSSPGVPFNSLVRAASGVNRLTPRFQSDYFPECDVCDNKASYQAMVVGDRAGFDEAFTRARDLWQTTYLAWQSQGPDPAEQALRGQFLDAESLEDIVLILDQIQP